MRSAIIAMLCLSPPAFADTFVLRSAPQAVTVYAEGAKVTRSLSVDLPAGVHDIVLPDLPAAAVWDLTQIDVANAVLGAVVRRDDALPPLEPADEAVEAARANLKQRQAELTNHLDAEAAIRLQSDAAAAQIDFLQNLAGNEGLVADASSLGDITTIIGAQTLQARQKILEVEQDIRGMSDQREALTEAVRAAEEALEALMTAGDDRAQTNLSVSAEGDTTADITLSYFVPAHWAPVYDVSLRQEAPTAVTIERGARITQNSGENWEGVQL